MSPFIVTYTGRRFPLATPLPGDVNRYDLAHALANLCRFGGHCRFFSVAQHCVQVAELVEPEQRLAALLHDAHEAYLGDVVRPLKKMLGPEYADLASGCDAAICDHFRLDRLAIHAAAIRHADELALAVEAANLLSGGMAEVATWPGFGPLLDEARRRGILLQRLRTWPPGEAELVFLDQLERCLAAREAGYE